jgi:hypothetical protein
VQILSKFLIVECAYFLSMTDHPIKKGPEGGKFQHSRKRDRYLLDKKIKTGPYGGHYQMYDDGGKRYLLKTKSVKVSKR